MYIFWSIRAAVWLPDFDFVFCAQRFNPCRVSPVLHQPSLARKKRSIRAFPAGLARDVRLHEQSQVRAVVQETKQLERASAEPQVTKFSGCRRQAGESGKAQKLGFQVGPKSQVGLCLMCDVRPACRALSILLSGTS